MAAFKNEIEASPYSIVLIILAIFWGSYVFLMALGISTDILPPGVAAQAIEIAHLSFFLGAFLSLFFLALVWIGVLISTLTSVTSQLGVILTAGSFIVLCFLYLLKRYRKKKVNV